MTAFGKHYDEKDLFKMVIWEELGPMNPVLCKFSTWLLNEIPTYFWTEPASSSGKNHPEFDLGEGGLARHSLMVYRWLKMLLEANEQDMREYFPGMVVACLFHDCCKRGLPGNTPSEHTVFEHPILSAKFLIDSSERFCRENAHLFDMSIEDEGIFKQNIAYAALAIESHMGRWNSNSHTNVVLPKPGNACQYMVHLADYCASRKCTSFDFEWLENLTAKMQ